jgi:cytochrome c oxidase subunit 2
MQSWIPFPESASTLSGEVDALYFYLCGVTAFFTLLIYAVVIYFVIRYRRRNPTEIPRPIEGSMKLETLWSVIPLLIAMTIPCRTKVYFARHRLATNALEERRRQKVDGSFSTRPAMRNRTQRPWASALN